MGMLEGGGGGGGPTLQYLAGFLDGEGCILLHVHNKGTRRKKITLDCFICQKDKLVLEKIQSIYGGKLLNNAGKGGQAWRLWWFNKKAQDLLTQLRPYLIVKSNVVDLALEFRTSIRGIRITEEEYQHRLRLKEEISKLNRRS